MIDIGQILANPKPFVDATRFWIENNAVLLASCAVGALTVAGGVGFGVGAVVDRIRDAADERRRFGGAKEAKHAGLLRNPKLECSGIPMGRIGRKHLCWVDQEPVLVTGGTRSGKGIGVIRPACLTYGGSIVMYDGGKGELFRTTSGYRARFSHVLNFDLTNPSGVHFNFLDEVDPDRPLAGADNIAKSVPRPNGSPNDFFESGAERLMGAVILHVLYGEHDNKKNMARVVEIISQGDEGMRMIIQAGAHPTAVSRATSLFAGLPFDDPPGGNAKERGGFYSSALNRLAPFEDPIVAKITSRSDFRMRDLFRLSPKKRPVSLYLTTPASEDDRLKPVVSMFLAQFINSVLAEQPAIEGQPMTLIVADEFPSLRMQILETAITKIVGCGATMLLGAQSLNALRQAPYGPYNLFRDNIRCHVAYAANDGMTQQEISQSCGNVPERRKSRSRSRQTGNWSGSRTETESDFEAPVMTPGKVRSMRDKYEVILITGQPVIRALKIRDFKDPILKKRLNLPCPPLRAPDGVYPDLPHPQRPSVWAGVMADQEKPATSPETTQEPAPSPAKPKRKRKLKLITAEGEE